MTPDQTSLDDYKTIKETDEETRRKDTIYMKYNTDNMGKYYKLKRIKDKTFNNPKRQSNFTSNNNLVVPKEKQRKCSQCGNLIPYQEKHYIQQEENATVYCKNCIKKVKAAELL